MHCDVYKFKLPDWYVYIARPDYPNDTDTIKDWLAVLPAKIRKKLGLGTFVMHIDLDKTPKLARVNIDDVKQKLATQGYFVQAPPADILAAQAMARAKDLQDKKYD